MNIARDRLPRWAEASVGVMEHIMKENEYGCISVLSLSNILRSGRPSAIGHDFAAPEEARTIVGLLCRG
eukprot:4015787-Heterocapsa_arctica.AAC.1